MSSRSGWRRASTTRSRTPRARALGAVATGINTRLGPGEVDRDPAALRTGRAAARGRHVRGSGRRARPQGADAARRGRRSVGGRHRAHRPASIATPATRCASCGPAAPPACPRARGSTTARWRRRPRLSNILSAYHDVRLMPVPFPHAGYMNKLWDQVEFVINSVLTGTPWTVGGDARPHGARARHRRPGRAHAVERSSSTCRSWPTPTSRRCGSPPPAPRRSRPSWPRRCARASAARSWCATRARSRRRSPAPRLDDPPEVLLHTVGRPQAGIELVLRDESGAPVPDGEVGVVTLRIAVQHGRLLERPGAHRRHAVARRLDHHQRPRAAPRRRQPRAHAAAPARCTSAAASTSIRSRSSASSPTTRRSSRVAIVGTPAPTIGEIGVAFVGAGRSRRSADARRAARRSCANGSPTTRRPTGSRWSPSCR